MGTSVSPWLEAAAPRPGGPRDANNDVNSITRSEFMELLVRIAAVGFRV